MENEASGRWESAPTPTTKREWILALIGPGIVMAMTGVGASDFITAAVNGAKFGVGLLWVIVMGALIKFFLSEGIARWQLETNTTILEAWCQKFPPFVRYLFIAYLSAWTFFLCGSLTAACGLAGHAIYPLPVGDKWSISVWGASHIIVAALLVFIGRYAFFEKVMAFLASMVFICTVAGAALSAPNLSQIAKGIFVPSEIPKGSAPYIMGTIGGVGGSVTLLAYSYWLIEDKRSGRQWRKATLVDLTVCYLMTAIFGLAVMILSAQIFYPSPNIIENSSILTQLADSLRSKVGNGGYWLYVLGFWSAVFSTALGCLNGIPYLFSHLVAMIKKVPEARHSEYTSSVSAWYRSYLIYMTLSALLLSWFKRPVAMVITFAILASFITPFIAATLLYMNNKREWVGKAKYGIVINILLALSLLLFVYLTGIEIKEQLSRA